MATLSKKTSITAKDCKKFLDGLDEVVMDTLLAGDTIRLGFATMAPRDVAAKTAKNPRTGAAVQVPAHIGVKVSVSSRIKDALKSK